MAKCGKCGKRGLKPYGISKRFYKCSCGYIGETPRKIKIKKPQVKYENSCADDFLDYLNSKW